MNGSGAIDLSDFLAFAGVFGTTCEDRLTVRSAGTGRRWLRCTMRRTARTGSITPLADRCAMGEWYGVTTDASGRVVRVYFSGTFSEEQQGG